jgi:hypothetical protein
MLGDNPIGEKNKEKRFVVLKGRKDRIKLMHKF